MNKFTTVFRRKSRALVTSIIASCALFSCPAGASPDEEAVKAQALFDDWTGRGAPACLARAADCSRHGETLFNAAHAFQAAGDRNKAIAARMTLIDPKYHLEGSEIGKKTLFLLAGDYQDLTEYARSAEFAESAVKVSPNSAAAPDTLMNATLLRLALGDMDQAVKNAEMYDKLFGARKPAEALKVWLGIAATRIEKGEFKEAKAILGRVIERMDRQGEPRERFLSHAFLGRTLAKLDDMKGAEKEYAHVRALWSNSQMQTNLLSEANTNPRNLGKVLEVVGEALFFFAEQKRKEVDAIQYPVYKGPATMDGIRKHINTKLVDWIKAKKPAIETAEREYRQILDLQPVPPPKWVVASASSVGKMWASFIAEFRAAPIPDEWKKNGKVPLAPEATFEDIRKAYYAALDEASEPQKQTAKQSFRMCVDYSVKFQYHDEYAQSCQVWLEKHYPKEFVHVDEIIPAIRPAVIPLDGGLILPASSE